MKSKTGKRPAGRRKSRTVIGLISGTSADGIDAVLVQITGHGLSTKVTQRAFVTHPYPDGFREFVLANSLPGSSAVDTVCRLNAVIGELFAEAAAAVAAKARMPMRKVDLIGSHGQTVHHLPAAERYFDREIRSTLQLGDPSVIAARTGVVTVGDFRSADVAQGGQGAPLVPFLDLILFRSVTCSRLLLNLGGIANFTVLPRACAREDVLAFDTGPANMVIDALMQRLFDEPYDKQGEVAASGDVDPILLQWMMSHPFFHQRPPKSTGREEFGASFVRRLLDEAGQLLPQDIISTAAEFTALSVYDQYVRFVRPSQPVQEVLVSGGGAHNRSLMSRLQSHFGAIPVQSVDRYGMSADAKEATLFAVLANETLHGGPGNLAAVTGASRDVVLGKICLP